MRRRLVTKNIPEILRKLGPDERCVDDDLPALWLTPSGSGGAYRVSCWNPRTKKTVVQTVGYTWEIGPTLARRAARQMIEAVKMGTDGPDTIVSVHTIIEKWLADADLTAKWKIQTWRNYRNIVNNHILPLLGKCPVESLGREEYQTLYDSVLEGRSPGTADAVIRCFQSALTWAEKAGLRRPDKPPISRYITKKKQVPRQMFISREQMDKLYNVLDALENQSVADLVRFLLLTGFRRGEAETLHWSQIDWAENAIHLPETKTGPQTRYVSNATLQFLRQQPGFAEGSGKVFQCGRRTLTKWWKRIRERADLPPEFRVHDLRHQFASEAISSGVSLPLVAALLGHSTTSTTERYAHLVSDRVKDAAESFSERLYRETKGDERGDEGLAAVVDLSAFRV